MGRYFLHGDGFMSLADAMTLVKPGPFTMFSRPLGISAKYESVGDARIYTTPIQKVVFVDEEERERPWYSRGRVDGAEQDIYMLPITDRVIVSRDRSGDLTVDFTQFEDRSAFQYEAVKKGFYVTKNSINSLQLELYTRSPAIFPKEWDKVYGVANFEYYTSDFPCSFVINNGNDMGVGIDFIDSFLKKTLPVQRAYRIRRVDVDDEIVLSRSN